MKFFRKESERALGSEGEDGEGGGEGAMFAGLRSGLSRSLLTESLVNIGLSPAHFSLAHFSARRPRTRTCIYVNGLG